MFFAKEEVKVSWNKKESYRAKSCDGLLHLYSDKRQTGTMIERGGFLTYVCVRLLHFIIAPRQNCILNEHSGSGLLFAQSKEDTVRDLENAKRYVM